MFNLWILYIILYKMVNNALDAWCMHKKMIASTFYSFFISFRKVFINEGRDFRFKKIIIVHLY